MERARRERKVARLACRELTIRARRIHVAANDDDHVYAVVDRFGVTSTGG